MIMLFFINNVYELPLDFALFIHHSFTFVIFILYYVFVHHSLHFNSTSGMYKLVTYKEQNL